MATTQFADPQICSSFPAPSCPIIPCIQKHGSFSCRTFPWAPTGLIPTTSDSFNPRAHSSRLVEIRSIKIPHSFNRPLHLTRSPDELSSWSVRPFSPMAPFVAGTSKQAVRLLNYTEQPMPGRILINTAAWSVGLERNTPIALLSLLLAPVTSDLTVMGGPSRVLEKDQHPKRATLRVHFSKWGYSSQDHR
jgi:hypothetical protein